MARRPGPRPAASSLSTGRALALGALIVVALAAFSSLRSAPSSTAITAAPPAAQAPGADPHDTPAPAQGAAKARRASEVWAAYDQLPAEQKTKAHLTDTLDAAAQIIKAEPRTADDRSLLEQQGVQFRRRAAPLVRPEARADGALADVLVPSPDRARCLEWGALWSQDASNMSMLGFTRIECAGSPPRVWELRR